VFKGHPLGVVSVRFKTEEGVQAALQRLDGRFFGGRRIGAALWDGITNYNFKVGRRGWGWQWRDGGKQRDLKGVMASPSRYWWWQARRATRAAGRLDCAGYLLQHKKRSCVGCLPHPTAPNPTQLGLRRPLPCSREARPGLVACPPHGTACAPLTNQVKETPEEEAARLEAYTRDMEAKATAAAAAAVPEAAAAATGGGSTGTGEAEPMDLAAS
jgi:hypothetical protein